jgi:hypothetical protein
VASLAGVALELDEDLCRQIADHYDDAPQRVADAALDRRYRAAKAEILRQFEEILAAGIVVEPWLLGGQPYGGARELVRVVRETRTIHVFLTRDGHGPHPAAVNLPGEADHPLREGSGVVRGGVELCHNDLVRAVHDLFGHVMLGAGFGPRGELKAAYHHMSVSSEATRAVLFTEHAAQVCWFYFGRHLRDRCGRVPARGERGYVPPPLRPYPEQKVFPADPALLEAFREMFRTEAA